MSPASLPCEIYALQHANAFARRPATNVMPVFLLFNGEYPQKRKLCSIRLERKYKGYKLPTEQAVWLLKSKTIPARWSGEVGL